MLTDTFFLYFLSFCVYFVSVYILLTMLTVLAGSNMWAQTFSYTESNKTLTIGVTEDLSNDNDAAGKVQTDILYRIDDKITITTLTLALLL